MENGETAGLGGRQPPAAGPGGSVPMSDYWMGFWSNSPMLLSASICGNYFSRGSGGAQTMVCFLKVQIKKSYVSVYVYLHIENLTFPLKYST